VEVTVKGLQEKANLARVSIILCKRQGVASVTHLNHMLPLKELPIVQGIKKQKNMK